MAAFPVFFFVAVALGMSVSILVVATLIGPRRHSDVKQMPYESGMDPIHSARQRFSIGFYLIAIEFLVFDVELLILYPWAVATGGRHSEPLGHGVFLVAMAFIAILTVGFVYTWRKGVFKWS